MVTFAASTRGQYLVCAYSIDTTDIISNPYCYTVVVGVEAPKIIPSSLQPSGVIRINYSNPFNLSVKFDQIVKRAPQDDAFIKLINLATNSTVEKINFQNKSSCWLANDTLVFTFGNAFQPLYNYSIVIDEGKLRK